jgi:hypothetical protein
MRAALSNLAGGGASILIAGVDAKGAEKARAFAEEAAIPVLVMAAEVVDTPACQYAFSMGVPNAAQRTVLQEALESQRRTNWVDVGGSAPESVSCQLQPARAELPRFPVLEWKERGVDSLLLMADQRCSRDVIEETVRHGQTTLFALGLESAPLAMTARWKNPTLYLHTGQFPRVSGSSARSLPSSWYEALGRDAAVLARQVLAGFPSETVDDARVVAELHKRAQSRLLSVSVKLVTTDRAGFSGQHRLPRDLRTSPLQRENSR